MGTPLRALNLAALALALGGCSYLAVQGAPDKRASASRSDLARQADAVFWDTLHSGRYEGIGRALEIQTAAYLQDPGDAVTAARAGWLHIWRLAEASRLASVPATITNDAVLARKYFEAAVALDPSEARYLGFLGSALLAEGAIHHDEKLTRRGYYTLRDSITAWPEFNLFTAGYVMAGQPSASDRFKEALDWQWQTLDRCSGTAMDRSTPDFSPYMARATSSGTKRVCWNSTIAPHNFEGFFLNMGDMLVKSGDWQVAQKVYANARLSPTYESWGYKDVLDERILKAAANVQAFNAPAGPKGNGMMQRSAYACMACHRH